MSIFNCTSPEELSILASAIAISLSKDKSDEEVELIGALLTAVGDMMALLISQRGLLDANQEKKEKMKDLKKQMKQLKNQ